MDCSLPGSSVPEIPRQEHWSGLPFPPPGDLPDSGVKPTSPASPALARGFFTTEPQGSPERSMDIYMHKHIQSGMIYNKLLTVELHMLILLFLVGNMTFSKLILSEYS